VTVVPDLPEAYLEMSPAERLVMTWRLVGGLEDPGECRIEIVQGAVTEGAELTVAQPFSMTMWAT
jgi:hypothetical protein